MRRACVRVWRKLICNSNKRTHRVYLTVLGSTFWYRAGLLPCFFTTASKRCMTVVAGMADWPFLPMWIFTSLVTSEVEIGRVLMVSSRSLVQDRSASAVQRFQNLCVFSQSYGAEVSAVFASLLVAKPMREDGGEEAGGTNARSSELTSGLKVEVPEYQKECTPSTAYVCRI